MCVKIQNVGHNLSVLPIHLVTYVCVQKCVATLKEFI